MFICYAGLDEVKVKGGGGGAGGGVLGAFFGFPRVVAIKGSAEQRAG